MFKNRLEIELHYKHRLNKFGNSPEYAWYKDWKEMGEVYENVCRLMYVDQWKLCHSVLDVGCGVGKFYHYLLMTSTVQNRPRKLFQFSYNGIDIGRQQTEMCTLKYGEYFQNIDLFEYHDKADYVVCTGFLDERFNLEAYISHMLSLANLGLVIEVSGAIDIRDVKKFNPTALRFCPNSLLYLIKKNH